MTHGCKICTCALKSTPCCYLRVYVIWVFSIQNIQNIQNQNPGSLVSNKGLFLCLSQKAYFSQHFSSFIAMIVHYYLQPKILHNMIVYTIFASTMDFLNNDHVHIMNRYSCLNLSPKTRQQWLRQSFSKTQKTHICPITVTHIKQSQLMADAIHSAVYH